MQYGGDAYRDGKFSSAPLLVEKRKCKSGADDYVASCGHIEMFTKLGRRACRFLPLPR